MGYTFTECSANQRFALDRLASLYRNLARGQISTRQFLFTLSVAATVWLFVTAMGGIIQTEASDYWKQVVQPILRTPIPLWLPCAVLPLTLVIVFTLGVSMSGKLQSNSQPTNLESELPDQFNETFTSEGFSDLPDSPVGSSTGELLSERTRVIDGEISAAEFASHVLYRLIQKRIGERAAKRLLTGLGFEIQSIGEGRYTLLDKTQERRSE